MVSSKSTPINRRAAQENAAMQNRERITNLVEKGKAAAIQSEKSGNTVAGDSFANQANYFADMAKKKVQNNYATPTNDLSLGYNPNNTSFNTDGTVNSQVQEDPLKANARNQYIKHKKGDPNNFESQYNTQIKPNVSSVLNNSGRTSLYTEDGELNQGEIRRLRNQGVSDEDINNMLEENKPAISAQSQIRDVKSKGSASGTWAGDDSGSIVGTKGNNANVIADEILLAALQAQGLVESTNVQSDGKTKANLNITPEEYYKLLESDSKALAFGSSNKSNNPIQVNTVPTKKDYNPIINDLVDSVHGAGTPMGAFLKMQVNQALLDRDAGLEQAGIDLNNTLTANKVEGEKMQLILDTIQNKYESNKEETDTMLKEKADSEQKFLLEQQERSKNFLEFQKNEAVRAAEKEKTQAVLQLSISQALGGRAFSGASNEAIASTEKSFSDSIASLAQSYDFKIDDSIATYTQKYQDVNTQFRFDIKAASDSLDEKIGNYSLNSFSNASSISKAKSAAVSEYSKNVTDIKTGYTTALEKMVNSISDLQEKKRVEAYNKKENDKKTAFSMFTDAFNNSTDPVYRAEALKMMKNAGYNLDGMSVNSMSLEQQLTVVDMMKKKMEMSGLSPDNFQGESREIMEGALGLAQKIGGSDDYKQQILDTIKRYVNEGDIEGAKERMEKYAASSLSGDEGKQYNIMTLAAESSAKLIDDLNAMVEDGTLRGKWVTKWNQVKNLANASKNPQYVNISSRIAAIASNELNRLSGAAISPEEYKRLTEFIPASNDTVLDAKNKLVEFEKLMKNYRSQTLSRITGIDRQDNVVDSSNTQSGYSNSFFDNMHGVSKPVIDGGGGAALSYVNIGKETQGFDTPIASRLEGGLYDQSTVDAWEGKHAGLDIAMPVGTNLPSLIDGKVIEVADNKGWGKTLVIEDQNGGKHRLSHLNGTLVKKGDTVSKGQLIASSGNTGNSTGPHLDYRIQVNGKYVNPSFYKYT